MWSFIAFLLKLLTDKITSKWLWIPLIIVGMIYGLKLASPSSYKLFVTTIVQSGVIVQTFWIRLICFAIIFIGLYALLRKSNSEFEREWKEQHPEYTPYHSKDDRLIQTTVSEERKFIDGKIMIRRKITIKNKLNSDIKYLKGKVIFFDYDIKVFEVPFEEKGIFTCYGVVVFDDLLNSEGRKEIWNEFRIEIEKIEYADKVEENIDLYGVHFYRTYFMNRFNYRLFGFLRVRYEVSWLKNQWNWKIKPWLFHYYKYPRIYLYRGVKLPYKQRMRYFWKRKMNQGIWLSVVAPICIFLYLSLSGVFLTTYNLVPIWTSFFEEVFQNIFT